MKKGRTTAPGSSGTSMQSPPGRAEEWLLRLDLNLAAEGATADGQAGEAFLLPRRNGSSGWT